MKDLLFIILRFKKKEKCNKCEKNHMLIKVQNEKNYCL